MHFFGTGQGGKKKNSNTALTPTSKAIKEEINGQMLATIQALL